MAIRVGGVTGPYSNEIKLATIGNVHVHVPVTYMCQWSECTHVVYVHVHVLVRACGMCMCVHVGVCLY